MQGNELRLFWAMTFPIFILLKSRMIYVIQSQVKLTWISLTTGDPSIGSFSSVVLTVLKTFSVVSELVVCWVVVWNTDWEPSNFIDEEENMLLDVLKFVGFDGVMSSWFNVLSS